VITGSKWTDEQGLVRFENALKGFHSSHGKANLSDVPWPSGEKHPSNVMSTLTNPLGREGVTEQFFNYARKARSREQVQQLMHQTVASFQPETWKEKRILNIFGEVYAMMVAREAEIVATTVAKMLKDLEAEGAVE